jgi:2-polyprenyl-3-methyl-5-hydroxy-6-metoxy-1,4-benzoquinol methylase
MTQIEDTGERILLEKETPMMIARHLSAYKFSGDYASGASILDIACGEGYGSAYLADFAKSVKAIDYSREAVDYANSKYKKDNLQFTVMDVRNLASISERFSVICSFQFIEHLSDPGPFLENVRGLLEDDGIFLCSTPNKTDASGKSNTPLNKFHLKEYLYPEFKGLLEKYFREVRLFGLKRSPRLNFYRRLKKMGIFDCLPDPLNPVKGFYNKLDCANFAIVKHNFDTALDFIAVCRK